MKDHALMMDDITDSTDCMTLRLGSYIIGKGLVLLSLLLPLSPFITP